MIGFLFGIGCTIISVLLFSFFAQLAAGGLTSLTGESWLYFSLVVPL